LVVMDSKRRIDYQPAMHLSMNSLFRAGDTLDCLAISSHLIRFLSLAAFALGTAGVAGVAGLAAEAAVGWAGPVLGAGTAGVAAVAGRTLFFGADAVFDLVLAFAETQALT